MKQRLASAARPARTVFRKEVELAVHDAVGATQASVASELGEIKRILVDDMDAANEATAVFGRLLAKLGDRLAGIEERLASLDERLEALTGSRASVAPARRQPGPKAAAGESGGPAPAAKE